MVLFMPTKTVGTHAATCDHVVLVVLYFESRKIFIVVQILKSTNKKPKEERLGKSSTFNEFGNKSSSAMPIGSKTRLGSSMDPTWPQKWTL